MSVGPVENHRQREKGVLVYPVYSRRTGGLSVGINLFPGTKCCSFDCPYCEVYPFETKAEFSVEQMEEDLRSAISEALKQGLSVKDICFSGNGEPTMSPDLPVALERAGRVRYEMVPNTELVLITNGTGLLKENIFSQLKSAATGPLALDIWLKLDAGTPQWYEKMCRSKIPFDKIIAKIREFAAQTPLTIQTMLCVVDGTGPSPEEDEAWEKLVVELAQSVNIFKVQIYGKARPSPEDPKTTALPIGYLEERAESLRMAFSAALNAPPPVEVFP